MERKRRDGEWPEHQQLVLFRCEHDFSRIWHAQLTFALFIHVINASTSNEDVVSDGEDTLTTNPLSISGSDPGIVENSCFVQLHTTIVDLTSKRDLVRMEVGEAGSASDLVRMIAQDFGDGFGSKQDVGIRAKV